MALATGPLGRVLIAVVMVATVFAAGCSGGEHDRWAQDNVDSPTWTVEFPGLATDSDGTGSMTVAYAVEPGEHTLYASVLAAAEEPDEGWDTDLGPVALAPDGFAEMSVPGSGVEQLLYGVEADKDEDILECLEPWPQDLANPSGTVRYQPTSDAIEITVTLDQAAPNHQFDLRVNIEGTCPGSPW